MPAIAAITINDGAATPASHVFAPIDVKSGVGELAERRPSGSLVGENKLGLSTRRVSASRRDKSEIRLAIPKVVTETVNGVSVDKVVGTSYIRILADWDSNHTLDERTALKGLVRNAMAATGQDLLDKVFRGVERVYG